MYDRYMTDRFYLQKHTIYLIELPERTSRLNSSTSMVGQDGGRQAWKNAPTESSYKREEKSSDVVGHEKLSCIWIGSRTFFPAWCLCVNHKEGCFHALEFWKRRVCIGHSCSWQNGLPLFKSEHEKWTMIEEPWLLYDDVVLFNDKFGFCLASFSASEHIGWMERQAIVN
jgi:hypothetical protein